MGASPRSRIDISASRVDPRESTRRVGRIQMQGRERFRRRGAERTERNEGRSGTRNLRRAGRERLDRVLDRPAHRRSRTLGRLDRANALPQHLAAAPDLGRIGAFLRRQSRREKDAAGLAGRFEPRPGGRWRLGTSDVGRRLERNAFAGRRATRDRRAHRIPGNGPDGRKRRFAASDARSHAMTNDSAKMPDALLRVERISKKFRRRRRLARRHPSHPDGRNHRTGRRQRSRQVDPYQDHQRRAHA